MPINTRRTLSASGDFQITQAGFGVGPGGWLVTVLGSSWTGSLVFKQNQAPPGAIANLVTIPYTNPDTGAISPAGTAVTSNTGFIVTVPYTANNLDVSYTHTAGSVQITVESAQNTTVAGGVQIPAADVSSGTFGANIPDLGIYSFPSQLGVGSTALSRIGIVWGGSVSAGVSGAAIGINSGGTIVAGANSDLLIGLNASLVMTPGAFTGLSARGLNISAFSVAAFTSPGTPAGIVIGVVTGKAGADTHGLRINPPTGGDSNYLIAHGSSAATFNVTSTGAITAAAAAGIALTNIGASMSVGATTPQTYQGLRMVSVLTGNTNHVGVLWQGTFDSTATSSGAGLYSQVNTAAAAFTMTNGYGLYVDTPSKGAASAITNAYGLYINAQTGGATINRAIQTIGGAGSNFGDGTSTPVVTIDGTGYGAAAASLRLNGLTTGAAASVGTLTNAPSAGNPNFWVPINIAGTVRYFPAW